MKVGMVRFVASSAATHADDVKARGVHDILFEDEDCASLLAACQPELAWGRTSHSQPLRNLAYGDFASLVLTVATVDDDLHAAVLVADYILAPACLDRLWKEVLKGMSADSWAQCGKGEFRERLRAAAIGPACTAATL